MGAAVAGGNSALVDLELTELRRLIGKRAVGFVVPAVARAGAALLRLSRHRPDHRLLEQDVTGGGAESTWHRLLAVNVLCDPTEFWIVGDERRLVSAAEAAQWPGGGSCAFPLRVPLRSADMRERVLTLLDVLGARGE